jgi:hypothetical protein
VENSSLEPKATVERRWEETLRLRSSPDLTPMSSVTAGRAIADPVLTQRAHLRARAAFAGTPEADGADYVLGELLGAGGMGKVYAASQVNLDRPVAVKVLRPDCQADDAARQEFVAEALVAGDMDHPNTVPVYDLGLTSEDSLFYAMKLARGTAWHSTIATETIENNLDILLKVCDVVSFAHDKGVIHRDLKPENVMVGAYGEVLLMDWGLAASVGSPRTRPLDEDNLFAGTPAFMAPEVANCDLKRIGKASDIYLLGGILYQIVTGLTPHFGSEVMTCLEAAMRNEFQPTEKTGELLAVALRAMHTEPNERYTSVKDFARAIRDCMEHQISIEFNSRAGVRFEALPGLASDAFYHECEEIIGLLQRALAYWPGNSAAAERLVWLRETLAAVALRRGEISLARSSAQAAEQDRRLHGIETLRPDPIAERIKSSLTERNPRSRK